MNLANNIPDFNAPVVEHARKDFPLLDADMTVGEALERIRREGVGERVIYFYAIDEEQRLVGVVPTRRLLTAPLETALREVMVRRVVAVPAKATVLDACEFFVLYKFLAFPVVDEQRRMVGVIDANLFAEEIWKQAILRINPAVARLCPSVRSFLRRSVFASNKSVVHRRGALFDSASRGCS